MPSRWICIKSGNLVNCPGNLDPNERPDSGIEVHFINIGSVLGGTAGDQGESILTRVNVGTSQEKNILYDAGTPKAGVHVLDYLKLIGASRLDAMIASHPHHDHMGGYEAVLQAIQNGDLEGEVFFDNGYPRFGSNFYDNVVNLLQQLEGKLKYTPVESDLHLKNIEDVNTKLLLFVDKRFKSGEDAPGLIYKSVLMKITYRDATFLFTGDTRGDPAGIKKKSEYRIVEDYGNKLRADVMKASEHGTNNGNTNILLDAVKPRIIGISAKAASDHPDSRAIERFDSRGIRWFSTNRDGTFIIRTEGIKDNEEVLRYHIQFGISDPA
jgi:beta-lactamase superfamily II metal-dependent hydrolase